MLSEMNMKLLKFFLQNKKCSMQGMISNKVDKFGNFEWTKHELSKLQNKERGILCEAKIFFEYSDLGRCNEDAGFLSSTFLWKSRG